MVVKVEHWLCEDIPELSDLESLFTVVAPNKCVKLTWYVKNKGSRKRIITYKDIKTMTPEEYYERYILCKKVDN